MRKCIYCHDKATNSVLVEGVTVIYVCDRHLKRMSKGATTFVCRHCHVEVVSKKDHRPIPGRSHKKSCPRHLKYG